MSDNDIINFLNSRNNSLENQLRDVMYSCSARMEEFMLDNHDENDWANQVILDREMHFELSMSRHN